MTGIRGVLRGASGFASDRWLYAWGLGYAAVGAASLLVPLYALTLGGGPLVVGALEASAGLAGVPGALLWGRIADRTGQRRGFVLLSLAGAGLTLSVFPVLDSLAGLLAVNALFWFLVSAATPVVTLFVIENVPERDWELRIGVLNAYQRYGWGGGLVVGTVWLGVATRSVSPRFAQQSFFVVCAGAALLATPLAFYWLPPAATVPARRLVGAHRSVHRLVAGSGRYVKLIPFAPSRAVVALRQVRSEGPLARFSGALRRYLLTTFLFSLGAAMFFGPVPAYLTDLGYSSALVFVFFILASLASAVLFVPVGRLAAEVHPKSLQVAALGVRTLLFPAIGAVGLVSHLGRAGVGLAVGFLLVGVTWAVIAVTGAGLVSRSAAPRQRGEALGMYTALAGIGGGIGGLLGGYGASVVGYQLTFGLAGGVVLLGVVVLVSIRFGFAAGGEPSVT